VARSYLSRITSSPAATPLLPARPVQSVWKAARLDSLPGMDVAPGVPDRHAMALRPAAPGETRIVERVVAKAPDRFENPAESRRNSDREEKLLSPALPHKTQYNGPGPQDTTSETRPSRAAEIPRPSARLTRKENLQVREPADRAKRPAKAQPETIELQPAVQRSHPLPSDPPRPSAARGRTPDIGGRPANESPAQKSLHIGAIEIQIVPPAVRMMPAPQPKPKSRLARGYSLWAQRTPL
jgi:hypothetical protein